MALFCSGSGFLPVLAAYSRANGFVVLDEEIEQD
jgi:hypothetical protein